MARGSGANKDAYEAQEDELDYRILVCDATKGFDFSVTHSEEVIFVLGFEQQVMDPQAVFIGSAKHHPQTLPLRLDSGNTACHGQPDMTQAGVYIWYETQNGDWHIRYWGETSTAYACGGQIFTSGLLANIRPQGLDTGLTLADNKLFNNDGDGTFVDVSIAAGLDSFFGYSSSAVFCDFDNDSDLDIYVVCTGAMSNAPNLLYENIGQGRFRDVADVCGAQAMVPGRGESAAVADYNGDGFMDLLVVNGAGEYPACLGQRALLHNLGNSNNWLDIQPVCQLSNSDAIGAFVTLQADGLTLKKQVTGGVHRVSQNQNRVHFGLSNAGRVDRIDIVWPSGIRQELSDVHPNQVLRVQEPLVDVSVTCDQTDFHLGDTFAPLLVMNHHGGSRRQVTLETNVRLENGSVYPDPPEYLIGPTTVWLSPGQTFSRQVAHTIPQDSRILGQNTYQVFVTGADGQIIDESRFDFTVIPLYGSK